MSLQSFQQAGHNGRTEWVCQVNQAWPRWQLELGGIPTGDPYRTQYPPCSLPNLDIRFRDPRQVCIQFHTDYPAKLQLRRQQYGPPLPATEVDERIVLYDI